MADGSIKIAKENHLDFLQDLHLRGISLDEEKMKLLYESGRVDKPNSDFKHPRKKFPKRPVDTSVKSESEIESDDFLDIIRGEAPDEEVKVVSEEERSEMEEKAVYIGQKTINKEDWMPDSVIEHKKAFVEWIDSINFGNVDYTKDYEGMAYYKKFYLYKQQADQWLAENKNINNCRTREERREYINEEFRRCDENSVYYLNRYVVLKEGNLVSGTMRYEAQAAHYIICYIFDCGYSFYLGKPRQIAATSTLGALGKKKIIFNKNMFLKMIAQDKDKVQEIFDDKIKYPFGELPMWMKPSVFNDRDNILTLKKKSEKKGTKKGLHSKLQVVAPSVAAINGGSPNIVFIDEAGYIPILGKMVREGRPTMFMRDPITKKLIMKRQLCVWGCVCAGTKVWDNYGNLTNIEDLVPENGILGYNGEGISKEEIIYWQPPKEKNCYRITTNTGRFLECSDDHPILWSHTRFGITPRKFGRKFFKQTKFVEAKDIKPGDQVATIESVPIYGDKKMWEPRVVGWLIGDGTYGIDSSPVLSNCDSEINHYIESNFKTKEQLRYTTKDGRVYKETRISEICQKLREIGIYGQTKNNKRLPVNIQSYSKSDICELIGGIFDTDGCVHYTKDSRYIDLTSSCYELLNEVRFLLQKIGIHSNIKKIKAKPEPGSKDKNDWYVLYVSDKKSILCFYENIKFFIKYKQERMLLVLDNLKHTKSRVSRNSNGLRFEKVIKVEYIGQKPVYNLTAGTTHTYIANGIVTHNTGGEMDKGGKSYEDDYMNLIKSWKERKFESGIIPIFLNWTSRPGITREHFEKEKKAYTTAGADSEDRLVQFRQTYPTIIEDMFLTSHKTLLSVEFINRSIERIQREPHEMRSKYGFFEPVFDYNSPSDENSDVGFKITDAIFTECEEGDPRVSTIMFMTPYRNYIHRYYSGIDPVSSDNGFSLMSNSIWDNHFKTFACCVNYRDSNHKYTFLQNLLANLYYNASDRLKMIPTLVEANIGQAFVDYADYKGLINSFVMRTELPQILQGGQNIIGLDNRGNRNRVIINKMYELFSSFGDRIYIREYFEQLRTFTCTTTTSGQDTWGTSDKRKYFDDMLFSGTFAYICSLCYDHLEPREIKSESDKYVIRYPLTRDRNGNLTRTATKTKIY